MTVFKTHEHDGSVFQILKNDIFIGTTDVNPSFIHDGCLNNTWYTVTKQDLYDQLFIPPVFKEHTTKDSILGIIPALIIARDGNSIMIQISDPVASENYHREQYNDIGIAAFTVLFHPIFLNASTFKFRFQFTGASIHLYGVAVLLDSI